VAVNVATEQKVNALEARLDVAYVANSEISSQLKALAGKNQ
jgi:hypothetical protein